LHPTHSFAVFDEEGPARAFTLRQAYLLGADGAAVVGGEIDFHEGLVRCERRSKGSTALAIQWDCGAPGVFTLETCLLPEREQPYLLSLELARKRIMQFFVKLEEWGLVELPPDDPAIVVFEEARQAFTKALCADRGPGGAYTPEQDALARRAVSLAVDAGERLALRNARVQLGRRLRLPGFRPPQAPPALDLGPPNVGCAIFTDHFSEPLRAVVNDSFDFINLPMRWSEVEPEEDKHAFARLDKWMDWASRTAHKPVVAGPVIDFRPRCTPDWLYVWENDYDTLRELVYEHFKTLIARYKKAVNVWTVCSGLNVNANFTLSLEQIIDLTRLSVLIVRKLHPQARVIVEISQPFGEYSATNPQSLSPLMYAELLFQAGVSIDAIGLRIEMGDSEPGRATRDLMQIAELIDRFGVFEKPLAVTALGAPSEPPAESTLGADRRYDPGHWRSAWSDRVQADWLARAIAVCFSKPHVASVCWQELCDKPIDCETPFGALVKQSGHPKPSLKRIGEVRRRLRERRSIDDLISFDPSPSNGAPRAVGVGEPAPPGVL
jgi:hypothetical protein